MRSRGNLPFIDIATDVLLFSFVCFFAASLYRRIWTSLTIEMFHKIENFLRKKS